jgi:rare lipoprotein A
MPSYVEITALDTGRTILVRINDRGPMTNDRLIDLSEGAARQLGIVDKGTTGVRVRRVNPPENEKSALRAGRPRHCGWTRRNRF